MRLFALVLFCCTAVIAAAQGALVTQAEGAAVFARTEQAMRTVLEMKAQLPAFPSGASVLGREQILKRLDEMVMLAEPKFKFTPPKVRFIPSLVTLKSPAARQLAEKLVVLGFVDKAGSLVGSKADGLTVAEFGDAIGYFITRLAEMTHTPTRKFSPYLMPPGGG